jgi:hypothetical protein
VHLVSADDAHHHLLAAFKALPERLTPEMRARFPPSLISTLETVRTALPHVRACMRVCTLLTKPAGGSTRRTPCTCREASRRSWTD